jgi:hypothetical protein
MELSAEDRKLVDAGILAVENQSKAAEAQLIAAKAFDRLVMLLEQLLEKFTKKG